MPYTAAVLVDGQRSLLQIALCELRDVEAEGFLFQGPTYPLPHHLTINMGDFDPVLNCISMLGMPVELVIDGFWLCPDIGVCAARVVEATCRIVGDERQMDYYNPVKTINEQPHLTTALKPGVKPFDSNKLDWSEPGLMLKEPLKVKAKIEVCP